MIKVDSRLVRSCWEKIELAQYQQEYVAVFYHTLFQQHPHLRVLFPSDLKAQERKLLETLNQVINGLQYLEELKESLLELGRKHQDLNIDPALFEVVTGVSVVALKRVLDSNITQEELLAWEQAFRAVSAIMLQGYSGEQSRFGRQPIAIIK
ncbi:MAG: globin domain-containing protein [Gammaproteobacteria bacterium]|nr:globin domain-containing protein [Gammaproteobacteria bacterium]